MPRFGFPTSLAVTVIALALAPAGLGGQPVTQTLTPPPQPWLTCKAVGGGTICQGTLTESYGPENTGIVCGSGPGAFNIFDGGTRDVRKTRFYNEDGLLTRIVTHDRFPGSQWSNPLTGAVVPYTQSNIITLDFAVPGDLGSVTETTVGENILRDPATNKRVFISVGRSVIGPDGTVEFRSGTQNFLDLFVDEDPSVLDLVCTALAAA
jgi:hypothetical protein